MYSCQLNKAGKSIANQRGKVIFPSWKSRKVFETAQFKEIMLHVLQMRYASRCHLR